MKRKIFNRVISLFLVTVLLGTYSALAVAAEENIFDFEPTLESFVNLLAKPAPDATPSVSVSSASAKVDENVTVTVSYDNAGTALTAFEVEVGYDAAKLQPVSIAQGNVVEKFPRAVFDSNLNWNHRNQQYTNSVYDQGMDYDGTPITASGSLFTITFKALAAGTTNLQIGYCDFGDDNYNSLTVSKNNGSVTIANPTATTYTISYNANGGTDAPSAQTKTKDVALTLSSTKPSKSYTVTYNANGGSVSGSSKTVSCTFNKWNTASNGSGTSYNAGASYTANASATLYAQWTNPTAGTLPTPTRSGYTFEGWYTASSGGSQVTSSTTITANTTIYAHWTSSGGSSDPCAKGHSYKYWEEGEYWGDTLSLYRYCSRCNFCQEMCLVESEIDEMSVTGRSLSLHYKDTYQLGNTNMFVLGSDEKAVKVDLESGKLTAVNTGTDWVYAFEIKNPSATNTRSCLYASDLVAIGYKVEVSYTFLQLIIVIFLFGWLWY